MSCSVDPIRKSAATCRLYNPPLCAGWAIWKCPCCHYPGRARANRQASASSRPAFCFACFCRLTQEWVTVSAGVCLEPWKPSTSRQGKCLLHQFTGLHGTGSQLHLTVQRFKQCIGICAWAYWFMSQERALQRRSWGKKTYCWIIQNSVDWKYLKKKKVIYGWVVL